MNDEIDLEAIVAEQQATITRLARAVAKTQERHDEMVAMLERADEIICIALRLWDEDSDEGQRAWRWLVDDERLLTERREGDDT